VRDSGRAAVACGIALAAGVLAALVSGPARAADDDATARARAHYEMGLRLFDAREHDQALIEFETANALKTRPAAVFMIAQCEYLLGRLKEARNHYQAYVAQSPEGEFVELAKDRIQSIDKRPGTFAINTVPDEVDVRIVSESAPATPPLTGQAPNNFPVPRGRYRITVSKKNYLQQSHLVDIDLAETKPLFFKLDEIPARLEIETIPAGTTLYVNGNRVRNPYRQEVAPGHYEIIGEAPEHDQRAIEFALGAGERKLLTGDNRFRLSYTQRSGRAELIVASGIIGGFIGAGAVTAAIGSNVDAQNVGTVLLATGGGIAGAIAGALVATPLVPRYIPDNRALFILGMMWMGAAEGAGVGVVARQIATASGSLHDPCPGPEKPCRGPIGDQLRAAFIGAIPGLAVGLTTGAIASPRSPKYGRVALIQSAALGGALVGTLAQLGTRWHPYGRDWDYTVRTVDSEERVKNSFRDHCVLVSSPEERWQCPYPDTSVLDLMPGALIGLNVGILGGLLGAYLPDQSSYGPSWKRVLLVDLAAAAGAVAGAVGGCVADVSGCLSSSAPKEDARARAALASIGGALVGAVGGVLLTRHFDDEAPASPPIGDKPKISLSTTVVPLRAPDGSMVPGLGALGTF
jgi:hypothetical protein